MQLLLQPSAWKVGGRQGPRAGQARDSWHYPGAAGVAQECSHALAGHDKPGRAGFSKMWLGSWRRRGPTLPGRRCPTRSSTYSTRPGGSGTLGTQPTHETKSYNTFTASQKQSFDEQLGRGVKLPASCRPYRAWHLRLSASNTATRRSSSDDPPLRSPHLPYKKEKCDPEPRTASRRQPDRGFLVGPAPRNRVAVCQGGRLALLLTSCIRSKDHPIQAVPLPDMKSPTAAATHLFNTATGSRSIFKTSCPQD
mmetsp:Transcript_35062/g.83727  ORF Transcript_35062/g.83727 Transcript_35062/m.83727 type:complete len:252 (-) Transcript_35062:1514-2269(-)